MGNITLVIVLYYFSTLYNFRSLRHFTNYLITIDIISANCGQHDSQGTMSFKDSQAP
jgi:hypothetical protein